MQVGSDYDDRLEDCSLRLGGRLMSLYVVFYNRVMFLQHATFKVKRELAYNFGFRCRDNTRLIIGCRVRYRRWIKSHVVIMGLLELLLEHL